MLDEAGEVYLEAAMSKWRHEHAAAWPGRQPYQYMEGDTWAMPMMYWMSRLPSVQLGDPPVSEHGLPGRQHRHRVGSP